MPRRNLNAGYHRHKPKWSSERIYFLSEACPSGRPAGLRTTAEKIISEHRALNKSSPIIREKPNRLPWYKAVNWGVALEYICWGLAAAAMVYLTVAVFWPFAAYVLRGKIG